MLLEEPAKVLYAFRCREVLRVGIAHLDDYEKIWPRYQFFGCSEKSQNGHAFFGRGRVYAIYVSRLLKVVETQFFYKNDRNSRVYIGTYNNPKL